MTLGKLAAGVILGLGIVCTSKTLNGPYAFFEGTWPALIAICVMSYPLIELHAIYHTDKIKRGIWITHWKANVLRTLVGAAMVSLIHVFYFNLLKEAWLFAYAAFWFGIVFNLRLNKHRKLEPFYVGINDKKDGVTDRIFTNMPYGGVVLFVLELSGMGLSGWMYLK